MIAETQCNYSSATFTSILATLLWIRCFQLAYAHDRQSALNLATNEGASVSTCRTGCGRNIVTATSSSRRLLFEANTPKIVDVHRVADLKHALADPSVTEARIRTDLQLSEQEWPASELVTVPPGHSKLIAGAEGLDPALWPVLDFAFLPRRLQLSTNCTLTFSRLWVLRFSVQYLPLYPGVNLCLPVQPPHAGVLFSSVYIVFLTGPQYDPVASDRVSKALQSKRPESYPGTQMSGPVLSTASLCRAESAKYAAHCWDIGASHKWIDQAQDAVDVSQGPARPAGYYLAFLNTTIIVTYPYENSCIIQYGFDNCFNVQAARYRGKPLIPPRQSHRAPAKRTQMIAGCVIGGSAFLAVALGVAVWAIRKRRLTGSSNIPQAYADMDAMLMHAKGKDVNTLRGRPCIQAMSGPSASFRTNLSIGADLQVHEDIVLGLGLMGKVVAGTYFGEPVAVKLLHPSVFQRSSMTDGEASPSHKGGDSSLSTSRIARELQQEIEVLTRCRHDNIVRLLGACLSPSGSSTSLPAPFLVMERLPLTLHQVIHDTCDEPMASRATLNGDMQSANPVGLHALIPLEKVLAIAHGLASGLAYLHPTTIHRDLKPSNVLVNEDLSVVKIADFGSARYAYDTVVTDLGGIGTAQYMAPECFHSHRGVLTPACDVYSLGVIISEMLTGRRVWQAMSVLQIGVALNHFGERPPLPHDRARCPPALRKLVQACWLQDPGLRPTADTIAKKLAIILRHIQSGRDAHEIGTGPSPFDVTMRVDTTAQVHMLHAAMRPDHNALPIPSYRMAARELLATPMDKPDSFMLDVLRNIVIEARSFTVPRRTACCLQEA